MCLHQMDTETKPRLRVDIIEITASGMPNQFKIETRKGSQIATIGEGAQNTFIKTLVVGFQKWYTQNQ